VSSPSPAAEPVACPCGSGASYAECCGPVHAGRPAESAAALMRSRFTAFAFGIPDYLLRSWHPDTRPATLELDEDTRWRRLQIVDTADGGPGDETGIVEFRASYRSPDGAGLLHERSRFARVDGAWRYVDGELLGP
jgi:SEC-C motif domain protein